MFGQGWPNTEIWYNNGLNSNGWMLDQQNDVEDILMLLFNAKDLHFQISTPKICGYQQLNFGSKLCSSASFTPTEF